jgi:hypothetical protein
VPCKSLKLTAECLMYADIYLFFGRCYVVGMHYLVTLIMDADCRTPTFDPVDSAPSLFQL